MNNGIFSIQRPSMMIIPVKVVIWIIVLFLEISITLVVVAGDENMTSYRYHKIVFVAHKCGCDYNQDLITYNMTKNLTDKDRSLFNSKIHNFTSNLKSSWNNIAVHLPIVTNPPLNGRIGLVERTEFGGNSATTVAPLIPSRFEKLSKSISPGNTSGKVNRLITSSKPVIYSTIDSTPSINTSHQPGQLFDTKNMSNYLNSIQSITNEDDYNLVVTNLEDVAKIKDLYDDMLNIFLEVVNTILGFEKSVIAKAQKKYKTSSRILNTLELLAGYVRNDGSGDPLIVNLSRIAFLGIEFDPSSNYAVTGLTMMSSVANATTQQLEVKLLSGNISALPINSSAVINLPPSLISKALSMNGNIPTRVVTFAFINDHFFIPNKDLDEFSNSSNDKMNSSRDSIIMSASFSGLRIENLTEPMVSHFRSASRNESHSRSRCVFWDNKAADGYGDWSTRGCLMRSYQNEIYTCTCDHLTSFAVLLDVYQTGHFTPRYRETLVLDTITYIGCIISIIGLVLTLFTYLRFKNLRKTLPPRILICLCASLLALLIVFIVGIGRTKPRIECQIAGLLLHYLILTTFCWMAVEGYNLYRCFVKVVGVQNAQFLSKANQFCWGVPVLIVGLSASIDWKSYGNDKNCMLHGNMFYFAILAPVITVLTMNFVLLFLVLIGIQKGSKLSKDKKRQGLSQLRIAAACSVILGLTWSSAVLAVGQLRFSFQVIFCVLNSSQGFFIFLFYCVRNPEVRKEWKRALGLTRPAQGTESTSHSNRNRSANSRSSLSD